MTDMPKSNPFNEAGRRILASLVSYQAGRAGVDSTLKQTPAVVDESWAILAEKLLSELSKTTEISDEF